MIYISLYCEMTIPLGGLSLRLVNTEPWLRSQRCSSLGGSLLSNFIPCFQNLCLSCRWIRWSLVLKLSPKIKRIMRVNIKSLKKNLLKKKSCWQTVKVDNNYVPLVIMSRWNSLLEHGYCKTRMVYWIAHLKTHIKVKHMGIYASCLLKIIKTTSNTWKLFTNVSGSATYFSLYFTNLILRQTLN